eukprot:Opistho-2@93130
MAGIRWSIVAFIACAIGLSSAEFLKNQRGDARCAYVRIDGVDVEAVTFTEVFGDNDEVIVSETGARRSDPKRLIDYDFSVPFATADTPDDSKEPELTLRLRHSQGTSTQLCALSVWCASENGTAYELATSCIGLPYPLLPTYLVPTAPLDDEPHIALYTFNDKTKIPLSPLLRANRVSASLFVNVRRNDKTVNLFPGMDSCNSLLGKCWLQYDQSRLSILSPTGPKPMPEPSGAFDQRSLTCDHRRLADVFKVITTALGDFDSASSYDETQWTQNTVLYGLVESSRAYYTCNNVASYFSQWGEKNAILPLSTECLRPYGSAEYNNDPCCNMNLRWSQCCIPRNAAYVYSGAVNVQDTLIVDVCDAVNETNSKQFREVAAAIGEFGDLSLDRARCSAEFDFPALYSAIGKQRSSCDEAIYSAKECTADRDCYTSCYLGRCVVPYSNPFPYLLRCYIATIDAKTRMYLMNEWGVLGADEGTFEDAFRKAVSSQTCVGPTAGNLVDRGEWMKVDPTCDDDDNRVIFGRECPRHFVARPPTEEECTAEKTCNWRSCGNLQYCTVASATTEVGCALNRAKYRIWNAEKSRCELDNFNDYRLVCESAGGRYERNEECPPLCGCYVEGIDRESDCPVRTLNWRSDIYNYETGKFFDACQLIATPTDDWISTEADCTAACPECTYFLYNGCYDLTIPKDKCSTTSWSNVTMDCVADRGSSKAECEAGTGPFKWRQCGVNTVDDYYNSPAANCRKGRCIDDAYTKESKCTQASETNDYYTSWDYRKICFTSHVTAATCTSKNFTWRDDCEAACVDPILPQTFCASCRDDNTCSEVGSLSRCIAAVDTQDECTDPLVNGTWTRTLSLSNFECVLPAKSESECLPPDFCPTAIEPPSGWSTDGHEGVVRDCYGGCAIDQLPTEHACVQRIAGRGWHGSTSTCGLDVAVPVHERCLCYVDEFNTVELCNSAINGAVVTDNHPFLNITEGHVACFFYPSRFEGRDVCAYQHNQLPFTFARYTVFRIALPSGVWVDVTIEGLVTPEEGAAMISGAPIESLFFPSAPAPEGLTTFPDSSTWLSYERQCIADVPERICRGLYWADYGDFQGRCTTGDGTADSCAMASNAELKFTTHWTCGREKSYPQFDSYLDQQESICKEVPTLTWHSCAVDDFECRPYCEDTSRTDKESCEASRPWTFWSYQSAHGRGVCFTDLQRKKCIESGFDFHLRHIWIEGKYDSPEKCDGRCDVLPAETNTQEECEQAHECSETCRTCGAGHWQPRICVLTQVTTAEACDRLAHLSYNSILGIGWANGPKACFWGVTDPSKCKMDGYATRYDTCEMPMDQCELCISGSDKCPVAQGVLRCGINPWGRCDEAGCKAKERCDDVELSLWNATASAYTDGACLYPYSQFGNCPDGTTQTRIGCKSPQLVDPNNCPEGSTWVARATTEAECNARTGCSEPNFWAITRRTREECKVCQGTSKAQYAILKPTWNAGKWRPLSLVERKYDSVNKWTSGIDKKKLNAAMELAVTHKIATKMKSATMCLVARQYEVLKKFACACSGACPNEFVIPDPQRVGTDGASPDADGLPVLDEIGFGGVDDRSKGGHTLVIFTADSIAEGETARCQINYLSANTYAAQENGDAPVALTGTRRRRYTTPECLRYDLVRTAAEGTIVGRLLGDIHVVKIEGKAKIQLCMEKTVPAPGDDPLAAILTAPGFGKVSKEGKVFLESTDVTENARFICGDVVASGLYAPVRVAADAFTRITPVCGGDVSSGVNVAVIDGSTVYICVEDGTCYKSIETEKGVLFEVIADLRVDALLARDGATRIDPVDEGRPSFGFEVKGSRYVWAITKSGVYTRSSDPNATDSFRTRGYFKCGCNA